MKNKLIEKNTLLRFVNHTNGFDPIHKCTLYRTHFNAFFK